ncbi:unnamed protein product, partial [Dovyalis caffra]
EYQERFKDVKSLVKKMNTSFTEGYLIKVFIGGLKRDLRLAMKRFKPVDLKEAFEQAKLNKALRKTTQSKKTTQHTPLPIS